MNKDKTAAGSPSASTAPVTDSTAPADAAEAEAEATWTGAVTLVSKMPKEKGPGNRIAIFLNKDEAEKAKALMIGENLVGEGKELVIRKHEEAKVFDFETWAIEKKKEQEDNAKREAAMKLLSPEQMILLGLAKAPAPAKPAKAK